jgi:hypothetical protein
MAMRGVFPDPSRELGSAFDDKRRKTTDESPASKVSNLQEEERETDETSHVKRI